MEIFSILDVKLNKKKTLIKIDRSSERHTAVLHDNKITCLCSAESDFATEHLKVQPFRYI